MKYIVLPIHSNWVCLIMNGIKSIEVRSGDKLLNAIDRLKKEQGCAPCLIYVTKGQPCLFAPNDRNERYFIVNRPFSTDYLNGKVIAEFEAEAEEIGAVVYVKFNEDIVVVYETETLGENRLSERSRLSRKELWEYLGEKGGTAIHIKKDTLKALKPRELSDFGLKKAPQSWCYVEVNE